jgi:exosome complex component RRP42
MTNSSNVIVKVKRKKISELLTNGKRVDGRDLMDYRNISVKTGHIETAAGSALVTLGRTKVMTGVKIETGTPYQDKPQDGVLLTNVELVPLASPSFEPGPPNEDAVELARVVDRGIRESKAIDLSKLCIVPGKLVFIVFVDIYVLDHDGNLFDASTLASILALLTAKMKNYSVNKDGELKYGEDYIKLPLQNFPVEVSVGKIDDKMIVDPMLDEELVADALITTAVEKNGKVCAIQKRKTGTFSTDEVLMIIKMSQEKAEEIRKSVLVEYINEYEKA